MGLAQEIELLQFISNPSHGSKHNLFTEQPLEVFCKKGVLKNFTKFTGKHLFQSLFFNKLAGVACNFIKKRLWHRCFFVSFEKFLRTPILYNSSASLFLKERGTVV